jgi:hypothetical protein
LAEIARDPKIRNLHFLHVLVARAAKIDVAKVANSGFFSIGRQR